MDNRTFVVQREINRAISASAKQSSRIRRGLCRCEVLNNWADNRPPRPTKRLQGTTRDFASNRKNPATNPRRNSRRTRRDSCGDRPANARRQERLSHSDQVIIRRLNDRSLDVRPDYGGELARNLPSPTGSARHCFVRRSKGDDRRTGLENSGKISEETRSKLRWFCMRKIERLRKPNWIPNKSLSLP